MKIATAINRAATPFGVFGHRNFAFVWTSTTLLSIGTQMEALVLSWYVLNETGSPFLVGLTWTARMSLNWMALFAGAIADRVPRQRLLAAVEFIMAIFGLVMFGLLSSGHIEVWHIFGIIVVMGMVRVFQMPSAQSLVADTLPPERIGNGAAFNQVGMNIGMLGGPLVGGILFKAHGPEGAYIVIAMLYFMSGLTTLLIRRVERTVIPQRESVLRTAIEGLKYVKGEQVLWGTLVLALIIESSGWTFHTSLIPIFAEQVLNTDSVGLGWLMFAFGMGALGGSLGWAMVRNLKHVGKLMILSVVVWHAAILVFATSQSFFFSMLILMVIGCGWASTQVFLLTALLRTTQPEYRGRVVGLRSLANYAFALGSMSSGAMAGSWGTPPITTTRV